MVIKNPEKRRQCELILLDRAKKRSARFASLRPRVVSTVTELRDSLAHASRDSLWVSYASDLTRALVENVSQLGLPLGFGLFVHPLDMKIVSALASFFRRIAFTTDGGFIPEDELVEVLESGNRPNLFIGGSVSRSTRTITFWRGDLKPLTVPFSAFENLGTGTAPDFNRFAVIDCGQTVQLGDFEAAVDAILYEYDPEYRRCTAKQRQEEDRSFGASLRRLRKQRGLRREDFEPALSARTIARIEQGKVTRIQEKTLNTLAAYLSVEPQEIQTF